MKNKLLYCLLVLLVSLEIINILEFDEFKKNNTKEDIVEEKEIIKENKEIILFTGDSITDLYDLNKYYNYPDKYIYNSGISAYKTTDILRRYDNMITQYKADKLFLLIGSNDLSINRSVDDILIDTKEILMRARKNNPNIKLYYISIYPVNPKVDGSRAGKRKNSKIKEVNQKMKEYCSENNITYIDLYPLLADKNDNLKEDLTYDGLHVNSAGYEVVTKVLKEYVEE